MCCQGLGAPEGDSFGTCHCRCWTEGESHTSGSGWSCDPPSEENPAPEQHPHIQHPPRAGAWQPVLQQSSVAVIQHGTACQIQLMNSAGSLFSWNSRGKLNASSFEVILNPEGDTIVLVSPDVTVTEKSGANKLCSGLAALPLIRECGGADPSH